MPTTPNSSSSPAAERDRLLRLPLDRLRPHPRNANRMDGARRAKLAANIRSQDGAYPPLIVRPRPDEPDCYQILDGHQRHAVLRELGVATALCYCWPCDDATALRLLATLNRLEGADVPHKRATLLQELTALLPADDLALLLPEDAALIADTMALLTIDTEALTRDLALAEAAAQPREHVVTVAVPIESQAIVEEALRRAAAGLEGRNRRGRGFVTLCRAYLAAGAEQGDA